MTPMEIAVIWDRADMLKILEEFTEIPDKVKLLQLSKLMSSSDNVEKSKDEFQSILSSLPADLVSSFFLYLLTPPSEASEFSKAVHCSPLYDV